MKRLVSEIYESLGGDGLIAVAFWFCVLLVLAALAEGGEREEVERLAPAYSAETEVVLWDATRVDLLSDSTAWEVDYAPKWAESLGQAMYYGIVTGKRPGVVLLVRDIERERRYVYRAQTAAAKYGIELRVEKIQ